MSTTQGEPWEFEHAIEAAAITMFSVVTGVGTYVWDELQEPIRNQWRARARQVIKAAKIVLPERRP